MMRSPKFLAVAVRKPNQRILIKNEGYQSITHRLPWLGKPVLRGVVVLIESLVQGINALSFSASVAADTEKTGEELSSWAIITSIVMAFFLGMGLFVALPHFLTAVLSTNKLMDISAQSPLFHLVDGLFKVLILLAYVYLIALMKDIHRVFQYHGAEHKSIYAFEAGDDLTVENARKYSTLHPRCGTSFLFFLILISIVVFSAVFPLFRLTELSNNSVLNHLLMVVIKIFLMFPVAGLSYEFIKMCAFRMDSAFFRTLIWPGLMLQKLTTREPDDEQLEVALASLRQVLRLEKSLVTPQEIEVASLAELGRVQVSLTEFPEN